MAWVEQYEALARCPARRSDYAAQAREVFDQEQLARPRPNPARARTSRVGDA